MESANNRRRDWARADQVWDEYARTHDLTGQEHMAVGIDPDTREVFIGTSAHEIVARLEREGRFRPLYFRRVNSPYLYRRRGRR